MDDTMKFTLGIIAAVAVVFVGLFGVQGVGAFSSGGGLLASVSHSLQAAPTQNIFMTFNGFKDIHPIPLSTDEKGVSVLSTYASSQHPQQLYVGTDKGLFFSYDGGLTWHRFVTSDNEISEHVQVHALYELSDGSLLVSVFENGEGVVYRTKDLFFSLERVISFEGETAYSLFESGRFVYMGLSNGQVLEYSLSDETMRVVRSFNAPIVSIERTPYGDISLLSKKGDIYIAPSPSLETGRKVKATGGFFNLFSSQVQALEWTREGVLYILDDSGIRVSYDRGKSFDLLGGIPTGSPIDTFSVQGDTIYVMSGGHIYKSTDGAVYWKQVDSFTRSYDISRMHFFSSQQVMVW